MDCLLCNGTGFYRERYCSRCDGWGNLAAMLENPPKVNPLAKAIRRIEKPTYPPVLIMDDRTFRVYHPVRSPKDPTRKHLVTGLVLDKTDEEIRAGAAYLLSGSGVQSFHEDGTPHE